MSKYFIFIYSLFHRDTPLLCSGDKCMKYVLRIYQQTCFYLDAAAPLMPRSSAAGMSMKPI